MPFGRRRSQPTSNAPIMVPYRENGVVKYKPAVVPPRDPAFIDDDSEGLLAPEPTTDDATMRFTASGRPMPIFKASGLQSIAAATSIYTVPQLLPQMYTDESIIPVVIKNVIVSTPPSAPAVYRRRKSFLNKLKDGITSSSDDPTTKVVMMPRGEYLKYFVRQDGVYLGTEPDRFWTDVELEEKFGQYKKK